MTPSEASMKLAREWYAKCVRTAINWADDDNDHVDDLALLLDRVRTEALEEEAKRRQIETAPAPVADPDIEMYNRAVVRAVAQHARNQALAEAADLHESINPASDNERIKGDPGAGAMGAVIEYRDKIRELKERKSPSPPTAVTEGIDNE